MKILIPFFILLAFVGCSTIEKNSSPQLQWKVEELIGNEFALGTVDGDRIVFKDDEATILSFTLFSAFPTSWNVRKDTLHSKMQIPQSDGIDIVERNLRLLESHDDHFIVSEDGNKTYRLYKLSEQAFNELL
ncbi:hypothetical protein VDG1235_1638 [Verrucomicrobiia bacterium DG1235]|nr:hypothetical protein VDG1235_1638 [Verrucomicrobiae bacterium DG1235]